MEAFVKVVMVVKMGNTVNNELLSILRRSFYLERFDVFEDSV